MGYTCTVRRRRAKRNGEHLIVVFILDIQDAGPGLDVGHFIGLAIQFFNINGPVYVKSMQRVFYFQCHKKASSYDCV